MPNFDSDWTAQGCIPCPMHFEVFTCILRKQDYDCIQLLYYFSLPGLVLIVERHPTRTTEVQDSVPTFVLLNHERIAVQFLIKWNCQFLELVELERFFLT